VRYNEGFFPAGSLQPVFFRSWAPRQPKMALLCLHSALGNSADFQALGERLAGDPQHPVQVMAFDAPGNGHSRVNTGMSAVRLRRAVVEQWVQRSTLPVALLGSSAGSLPLFFAMDAQAQQPRWARMPLVLAEPSVDFTETVRDYVSGFAPFMAGRFRSLEEASKAWDASTLAEIAFDTPQAKLAFIRGRLRVDGAHLVPAMQAMQAQAMRPFDPFEGRPALHAPALVLWGDSTKHAPESELALARALPALQVERMVGSGHPLSLTRTCEMEAVARFLRAQTAFQEAQPTGAAS